MPSRLGRPPHCATATCPAERRRSYRRTSSPTPLLEQLPGIGGRGAGAEGGEVPGSDPQDLLGVGAPQLGEAAALAEEGEGVLEDVAVGAPALGGLGVQDGGALGVAGGLGEDGLGGGGGQAVPGGGGLGVVDQGLGQGGGRDGGDPDHVGQALAEEAAAARAVGDELGRLLDQGEGGRVVAGGVLDQGR